MKMRDITNIIKNNNELLYMIVQKNDGPYFSLNEDTKKQLTSLLALPCFKEKFYDLYEFFLKTDATEFRKVQKNIEMFERLDFLDELCDLYIDNFDSFYPEIPLNSFSLKFKETNDLKAIGETLIKLDKALQQLFSNPELESSFYLTNFDQGSKWIDVVIEKKEAFACFVAVVQFITSLGKDIQEIRVKEAEIEKIKIEKNISEETLESYKELNKMLIKEKIKSYSTTIQKEYYKKSDNQELNGRIAYSIETLADLYIENNFMRPTDLIAYNIPEGDLNPWGYIEEAEKKKIEYKEEKAD